MKLTLLLAQRHLDYLDRTAIAIRLRHGRTVSRNDLLRGLIEAARVRAGDLSEARSVDEIIARLR